MSSSYCADMIRKYERAIDELTIFKSKFDSFISEPSDFKYASDSLKNVIINYKPIDNGKLEKISGVLKKCTSNLEEIVNECNDKIDYWRLELQNALAREASGVQKNSDEGKN